MKKILYFDVHVFYSRNNGFSLPVKMEVGNEVEPSDDDVIEFAVKNLNLDSEDAKSVDYVESISEEMYNDMLPA